MRRVGHGTCSVMGLAEVTTMNGTKKACVILATLMIWGARPAQPQEPENSSYEETVGYRDGEISVTFEQTPVIVALNVIEAWTGFQIIVPAAVENQLVNL